MASIVDMLWRATDLISTSPLALSIALAATCTTGLAVASRLLREADLELALSAGTLARLSPKSAARRKRARRHAHPALIMRALGDDRPNPFVSSNFEREPSRYERAKLAVGSVTLAPLRVLLICVLVLLAWIVASIGLIGAPPTGTSAPRPLGPVRRAILSPLRLLIRGVVWAFGYYSISHRGKPSRTARVIVCNHVSFIDAGILAASLEVAFVSGAHWARLPIGGTLAKAHHTIAVDSSSHASRGEVLGAISARARSEFAWPPTVIFPEGVTTNGRSLICFKKGAFAPGVTVQPVVIRYPHRHCDPAWVYAGPALGGLVRAMLCQFVNYAEVTWLPPYEPSADEAADPALFAKNVRELMASALNVPTSGHTLDDVALQREAQHLRVPEDAAVVEFERLSSLFGVDRATVAQVLATFARIDKEHRGELSLEQWLAPVADGDDRAAKDARQELEAVFHLLDVDECGRVDFREYLLAVLLLDSGASDAGTHRQEAIKFAWDALVGSSCERKIAKSKVRAVLCALGERDAAEALLSPEGAAGDGDGQLDFAEFGARVSAHLDVLRAFSRRLLERLPSSELGASPAADGDECFSDADSILVPNANGDDASERNSPTLGAAAIVVKAPEAKAAYL